VRTLLLLLALLLALLLTPCSLLLQREQLRLQVSPRKVKSRPSTAEKKPYPSFRYCICCVCYCCVLCACACVPACVAILAAGCDSLRNPCC